MPREHWRFTANVPATTTAAAPAVIPLTIPVRIVRSIHWRVPHGNLGLMGWRITMGGVQVLPSAGDPWIVADGESGSWELEGYPDGGAWQLTGYNTGAYPHAVYLTIAADPVIQRPPLPSLIPAADLSVAPDLSHAGPPVRRP